MAIRSKTKKRLFILLGIVAVVVALGATVSAVRMAQIRADVQEAREQGMASYEAGEYFDAMHQLGRYLQSYPNDADVTYRYAQARLNVTEPDGRHLVEGARALRRALDLDPERTDLRLQLLDLYGRIGFFNESLDMADAVLRDQPDHVEALRAKVDAQLRLRMYDEVEAIAAECLEEDETGAYVRVDPIVDEGLRARAMALHQQSRHGAALPVAMAFTERQPHDYEMQRLVADLMHETDMSAAQRLAYVRALREQHPDDISFAVLQAVIAARLENESLAREALREVVDSDLSDVEDAVALDLLSELDRQKMFPQTMAVMERVVDQFEGTHIQRLLAYRLAMAERWDDLLERYGSLTEQGSRGDSTLLAMVAMAHFQQGDASAARPVLNQLRDRVNDSTAIEWVSVMDAVYAEPAVPAPDVVEVLRRTEEGGRTNPYFMHWLGTAYRQMGELDLAISAWQRAAQLSPNWTLPLVEAAQTMMGKGDTRDAAAVAQMALQRSPNDVRAAIVLAEAASMQWEMLTPEQAAEVQRLTDQIQQAAPFEPRSLVVQVRLLVLAEQYDAARERVEAALDADIQLPASALSQLADLMSSANATELHDRLMRSMGDSAAADASQRETLREVQALVDAGEHEQAREMVRQRLAAADGDDDRRVWRLTEAQLADSLNDAQAVSLWAQMVRDYPDDLGVQQRVVRSNMAWRDRQVVDRAIERLRDLSGDAALSWRVARARWLIEGSPEQQTSSDITRLLQEVLDEAPQHAQARLLLVQHYEQNGNESAAISQLARLAQSHPENVDVRLRLARLLQARGDDAQARLHLDQIAQMNDRMSGEQRQRVALTLVQQGEVTRAIHLLEPHHGETVDQDLLLARLYAGVGRAGEAEQLYNRLLAQPTKQVVEQVAGHYLGADRPDEAERVLGLLDEMDLPAGERELAYGDYYMRRNQLDEAAAYYRQAVDAAADRAVTWRRWAAHALIQGQPDEAIARLEAAGDALPDDALLTALAEHREAIGEVASYPAARMLVVALVHDAGNHEPALQAMQLLADADEPADALPALRTLAAEYPTFAAMQSLVYQLLFAEQSFDEAAALAERWMQASPQAAEPVWMLAEALSASGRWDEAMAAAQQWRQRGGANVARADQLIAEAQLNLGDSAGALQQIEPHLAEALASPDENAPLIMRAARAMIQSGQVERAAEILTPLLDTSAQWRAVWMQLAATLIEDDTRAAAWLEQVDPLVPADDHEERFRLAQAWWRLHERTQSASHREAVRRTLEPLTQAEPPYAPAVMGLAVLEDAAGNDAAAEQGYRQALALNANLPIAANNLAVILYERGEATDEAVRLARQAVEAAPEHAPFRHTLANALLERGDGEAALTEIRQAVTLDEDDPRWHVALAQALLRLSQPDAAANVLADIDIRFPAIEDVPDEVREDLEDVRRQLESR